MKTLPQVRISRDSYLALEAMTRDVLAACRHEAHDGTPIYFPDGSGHYAACWTRDFCYMVEGAGHLLPQAEILAGIDYLCRAQREDGFIPDRVGADGVAIFHPGPVDKPIGSQPPVDNQPFMAKLLCAAARLNLPIRDLKPYMDRMFHAMDAVPRLPDGLVAIDRNAPWVDYGFTDTVAKTGKTLFGSLLYWEACQEMAKTYQRWEQHEEAHEWFERGQHAGHRLFEFWNDEIGTFRAATRDCRQTDVWGSAYAAVLRVASKTQTERLGHWFRRNAGPLTLNGYVRHLPEGEYWQRLFIEVPRDTYQNGGFWAVPSGWVARTIAVVDEPFAVKMMESLVQQFKQDGVCEWISKDKQALPQYAASAACVLGSVARSKA